MNHPSSTLGSGPCDALPPGPAEELAVAWRSLPAKFVLFGLLAAWILLFQRLGNSTFGYIDTASLFGWLNYSYANSQDDEMGRYMPFLVLALCWWKRDELLAVPKVPWLGGAVILAAALVLHVLGFMIQQARLSTVAFYLGVYGLLGALWGRAFLRAVFFPFFLLVFCIPVGTLADTLTLPLRMLATTITAGISRYGLGVALIRSGTMIFDANGTFQYEVATACGGLRSLTATLALASIYAFVSLERSWKRLAMIASALPLAVAGNVLRLTIIIVVAEAFGQKTGDWVHENTFFSMLPYVPAFLGLGALGSLLREPLAASPSTAAADAAGRPDSPARDAGSDHRTAEPGAVDPNAKVRANATSDGRHVDADAEEDEELERERRRRAASRTGGYGPGKA
jgi:exosortase